MAKLSDHVFPESVWKAFGEHMGEEEEEGRIRKKEEEEQEEEEEDASWEPFGALFGPPPQPARLMSKMPSAFVP